MSDSLNETQVAAASAPIVAAAERPAGPCEVPCDVEEGLRTPTSCPSASSSRSLICSVGIVRG